MAGLSTKDLVGSLKVSADRVKKLESGDLDRVQLATLPRHAEAIGCRLELRYVAKGTPRGIQLSGWFGGIPALGHLTELGEPIGT